MWVTSAALPDQNICVRIDRKDRLGSTCTDNYICYLMRSQTNEFVSGLSEAIYGPNQVFDLIPLAGMPREADKGIDLDQYVKYIKGNSSITYFLYVCKDTTTRDEDAEKLRQSFEDNECSPSFKILYVKDASIIGNITQKDYENAVWISNNLILQDFFAMDENYQFIPDTFGKVYNWRD